MTDLDHVRESNPPSLLHQGWEYPIHSWTFVWDRRINCPFHSPISDNPCSHPPVQIFGTAAAAGTITSSLITELGKWVTNKRCKVSPLNCVHLSERATKDTRLILFTILHLTEMFPLSQIFLFVWRCGFQCIELHGHFFCSGHVKYNDLNQIYEWYQVMFYWQCFLLD